MLMMMATTIMLSATNVQRRCLHVLAFSSRSSSLNARSGIQPQVKRTLTFQITPLLLSRNVQKSNSLLRSLASEEEVLSNVGSAGDDSHSEKYVMIRKNKQSMAFRNGSPLVFSGSVQNTFQRGNDMDSDSNTLQMGSLVAVVVNGEPDKNSSKKSNSRNSRGRRGKQPTKIDYTHHLVDRSEGTTTTYSIDGDLISSKDDTAEVDTAISQGKLIGYGWFNPVSMYRVSIFCHQTSHPELFKQIKTLFKGKESDAETAKTVLELVLRTKVHDAIRSRSVLSLPSPSTDSYRLINGEGDGLSGLAVDIIGGRVAVVMASAAWCELYKETILGVLKEILHSEHHIYSAMDEPLDIVWRNTPMRLKQDGYEIEEDEADDAEDERASSPVIINENDIKYQTYPFDSTSQKTGFYCDQRENRFNLAQQCKGKKVLDLCCYNGGFALNAMVHGDAASCVGVDSSQDAIDAADANKDLNGLSSSALEFVKEDIGKYMKESESNGGEFDVIVLDPPKLAPMVSMLDRASRKYHSLNRDAMKLINKKEGGLLLTCSCSGAMTQKNGGQFFLETIQGAALSAGRRITLLRSSGAASCHTQDPASFPANAYLTAALFYVSPE